VRLTSPARQRARALGLKLGLWLIAGVATMGIVASAATATGHAEKPRTVVTTDMEQDDYASLIRYLLYTNELDTEGIIYTSGRFHWAGDGKGTEFFLPGREYTTPQTSWRWTGTRTIQDLALKAYADVFRNLRTHDRGYPTPAQLLSKVKVGNIDFENSMDRDTPGSDLIKRLLLDDDRRPLYLQAWGGTNTIARALKSIEDQYAGNPRWARIKEKVSRKAVILASGFQDETYAQYIAPTWPLIRVENLQAGYGTWGTTATSADAATSAASRPTASTSRAPGSRPTSRSARSARSTDRGSTGKRCRATNSTSSATPSRPGPAGVRR
jgi:hypothetical protein